VLLALALVFAGSRSATADQIDDAIASIRATAKSGDFAKTIQQMKSVADSDDQRVRDLLHELTACPDAVVTCAAYDLIGKRKDTTFLPTMRTRAEDKKMPTERPAVYQALLDAFLAIADDGKATHELFDGVVRRFLRINSEFTSRAIRTYSVVRDKDTIEKLIVWLFETESVSNPYAAINREVRANFDKAHVVLVECLKSLCGVEFPTADEYKKWWKDNKTNFKCPSLSKK
jgi:hypothetical protein